MCLQCANLGSIKINFTCDKNFAQNGDPISIEGSIDNSLGGTEVAYSGIFLEERNFTAIYHSTTRNSYHLNSIERINEGQKKVFRSSCQIPSDLTNSTAIGRVMSRYFVIVVHARMGCCGNIPSA